MPLRPTLRPSSRDRFISEKGSLLIVALLLSTVISIGLVGYLTLARTSLKLAHRTFFAHDAVNLAEAGLEEAIYCFNLMASGTAAATAWSEWTIVNTNAMRTLTPFNRDQNAIGTVKVYVHGYDGSDSAPYVISQASIAPFDGESPITKTLRIDLTNNTAVGYGLVARNGLTLTNSAYADSFNSNPTNSPTGPWASYPGTGATSNTAVAVLSGSVSMSNSSIIRGDLYLGSGVAAPAASRVTGTIHTNFTASYPLPTYPTAASVSNSYSYGSTLPTTLPVTGHLPAADGRYYYFCSNASIGTITIRTNTNVTIVGSNNTRMIRGMVIQSNATCFVYMDGTVTITGNNSINGSNWAGALRITTSSSGTCSFSNNSRINACLYAPNARLTTSNSPIFTGTFVVERVTAGNSVAFHYDRALQPSGGGWSVTSWFELNSLADRNTVGTLTNNFLP